MKRLALVTHRVLATAIAASLLLAIGAPRVGLAAEPTFGQPSATAAQGQPITITSTITGGDIASVEVVMHLVGNSPSIVVAAEQVQSIWQAQAAIDVATSSLCACLANGQSAPNTQFDYQFRVHSTDGTTSVGPVGQAVVTDTRFTWQTLEQGNVRIHWYAGDQAFASSAADAANSAIDTASQALGVTIDKPFDMFVYATEEAMRSAVSPNRENVQAEAHPDIDTIFAWLPSNQPADQYNRVVISHELTHLVFHHAVDNPYNGVPRWLDEGVAEYLSQGYTDYWKGFVNGGAANRTLIPLQGLAGLFPSVQAEFYLAYGEAVAAVDFFIRTYGESKLWELVNSYSEGVSDDEAFIAAIGMDVEAFNKAWFESLSLEPQDPVGPQAGAPGPVPSDWSGAGGAPATLSPSSGPGATGSASSAPGATTRPATSPGASTPGASAPPAVTEAGRTDMTGVFLLLALVVVLIVGTVLVGLALRSRASGPPAPPSY